MSQTTTHGPADPADRIIGYLDARGQLPRPQVTRLTGGVSGETFLVESPPSRVVVKRTLDKLLVAGDWRAKPERAMTEAAALRLLHGITPECTPELLDADPETNTVVISAAPAEWVNWKEALLGVVVDPTTGPVDVAAELGTVLGHWHRDTRQNPQVAEDFDDYEAFEQLRVDPFHRTVARAHPDLAAVINSCADELLTRRDCLVHGDFSPKNVLVGRDGLMVLDFEVAHFGAAVFDLAFMSCHLALKALHLPDRADVLASAAAALVRAYRETAGWAAGSAAGSAADDDHVTTRLGWHTACLMLARVDGLSPAGYLSAETASAVRDIAAAALCGSDTSAGALWDLVTHPSREVRP
ncbi:MAG: hypothetical protein BGO26_18355 [Actinobacteria bacterium 69-20]|nr:aminoglycoside phosphotransferase family protein [Actinomycetota bacterium]OJV24546.1 MAG: hypothetical protein BGO26_18355 [Actinobacteria bacterium 69-20]